MAGPDAPGSEAADAAEAPGSEASPAFGDAAEAAAEAAQAEAAAESSPGGSCAPEAPTTFGDEAGAAAEAAQAEASDPGAQDPAAEAEWVEVDQPLRMQKVYETVRRCFRRLDLCRGGTEDEKKERVDSCASEVCIRKVLLEEGSGLYRVPRDGDCAFASISVGLTGTTRHKGCLRRLATQLLEMQLSKTDQSAAGGARLATLPSVKNDFASPGTAVDVDGLVYLAKHLNVDLCVLQERMFREGEAASDFQWWEYRGSRRLLSSDEDDVPMVIKLAQNLHPTPHWDAVLRTNHEHGSMVSLGQPCPLLDSQLELDCDCEATSALSRDNVDRSGEGQRELKAAQLLDGREGAKRAHNEQGVKNYLVTSRITGVEDTKEIARLTMGIQAQEWWTPLQAPVVGEWECTRCTYRNSAAAVECNVCSAPVAEEVGDDVTSSGSSTRTRQQVVCGLLFLLFCLITTSSRRAILPGRRWCRRRRSVAADYEGGDI